MTEFEIAKEIIKTCENACDGMKAICRTIEYALDKQIAQKPAKKSHFCPSCNTLLDGEEYCRICGQHIDKTEETL